MALQGGMLLLVLVLNVTWKVIQGIKNPEADPMCNAVEFHKCIKSMEGVDTCNATSSWVECMNLNEYNLKLMDCNDWQRKSAKRLVTIYTEADKMVCSADSKIFQEKKNTDEEALFKEKCWDTIRFRVLNDFFGYGTLPCQISEWSKNKSLGDLGYYCNKEAATKFYYDIRKVADCTDGVAGLVAHAAAVVAMALASLLATSALWQR